MSSYRYDFSNFRSPRRTKDGRLTVDARLSRTGVYEYRRADGSIQRELRLPEDVFSPSALDALQGCPVTDDHPATGAVTADTARGVAVGAVADRPRQDGDFVAATLSIFDAKTIKKVQAGKTQLSVGYSVDYDPTPGTHPQYGRYDGVQRAITPNHVAIVSAGRAGPEARIRMDAGDAVAHTSVRAEIEELLAERRPDVRVDSGPMSDRELYCAVIEQIAGADKLDEITSDGRPMRERSDDYLSGAAEFFVRNAKRAGAPKGSNGVRVDVQTARARMTDEMRDAWRKPIGVRKSDDGEGSN